MTGIGIDERHGGGGGDLLDQMIALESAAYAMVPGPLLGTTVVAQVAQVTGIDEVLAGIAAGDIAGIALEGTVAVDGSGAEGEIAAALDVVEARWLLASAGDGSWVLIDAEGWTAEPVIGIDLSRRGGRVRVAATADQVTALPGADDETIRRVLVALAAAEAAGVAQWCLDTAVDYAKVREQFGKPIGSFQAIKHLCSQMLETTESINAVTWDLAPPHRVTSQPAKPTSPPTWPQPSHSTAPSRSPATASRCWAESASPSSTTHTSTSVALLPSSVAVAALTGGAEQSATRLARRAIAGQRRSFDIDFEGADAEFRTVTRERVDAIAALPADKQRAALAEAGYLTPHWPAPYGLDAGPVQQLVVDEELARAGLIRPDLVIGAWAVPTIVQHGTAEQTEKFVMPTLLGDIFWCQLFSEPGAGSDLAALSTRAVQTEGGWLLTGQKVWTSRAKDAQWGICLARTDKDARHKGITYFLVDMASTGIDIRPLRELTGDAMFNEVFLDDVFVPDDCVVGEVNGGWKLARTTLANERVAMGSSKLGVSTERAVDLIADRESDTDAALVGHQVALATLCQLLGVRSTLRSIGGQGPGPESSVAKLLGVRNRQEAAELVVDLLGPCGAVHHGRSADRQGRARDAAEPVPVDRRRHDADPAQRRRRTRPRTTPQLSRVRRHPRPEPP